MARSCPGPEVRGVRHRDPDAPGVLVVGAADLEVSRVLMGGVRWDGRSGSRVRRCSRWV